MNLRNIGLTVSLVIAGLVLTISLVISSWKQTTYGTLHVNAALLTKYIELAGINIFAEGNTPAQIRAISASSRGIVKNKPSPITLVENTTFPGPAGPVPIRIYSHRQNPGSPIIIYYHGGGWVIGSLDSHDNICRLLALKTGGIVVSVQYRLAPEHPFPAAFEDAYAALEWVSQNASTLNGDPDKIVVAGDSAGGNLAAAVTLSSRDRNGPRISNQVLIYPATNLYEMTTDSHHNFANGFYLTKNYLENFRLLYLPDPEEWPSPLASPLLAASFKKLPPAIVLTAEFDPLKDEGKAYADKLKSAGVPVTYINYKGMIHGFLSMDRLFGQAGQQAIGDIASYLSKDIF